jgi:UDP-glucose 4-epimerase
LVGPIERQGKGVAVKILVTGGSGRLGQSVVATLSQAGHVVLSVDRVADAGTAVDLTDAAATLAVFEQFRPEAVVQLAAIAVPFSAPESVIYETNTRIAFTVFSAAVAVGARLVLAASSPTVIGYGASAGAAAGWMPTSLPIDETHQLAPWNAYSLSKQAVEDAVAAFARNSPLADGRPATTFGAFRPCYVISPEEWAGAPTQQGHTVLERLQRPELAAVSLFNYIDSRDAADFVLAWLARSDADAATSAAVNGQVFFVGAADALATRPLAELLPTYLPGSDELAARLTGDLPAFSSARAEQLLGWRATRSWRNELAGAGALAGTTRPAADYTRSEAHA